MAPSVKAIKAIKATKRERKKKDFVLSVVDGVACFKFYNMLMMSQMFEPVSVFVEGRTSTPRIGHNFPMSKLIEYSRCKGQRSTTDIISCLVMSGASVETKYIIAYLDGDVLTKRHELQHAKFYKDHAFRANVKNIWSMMDGRKRQHIEGFLKRMGYPEDVWIDEFQAYYLTEKPNFFGISLDLDLYLD